MLLFKTETSVLYERRLLTHKTTLAHIFILVLALCICGCGKRKPPVPPSMSADRERVRISGSQQGDVIELTVPIATKVTGKGRQNILTRVDFYRLAESRNSPLALNEEEFASRSTLIGTVDISAADKAKKEIRFRDTLQLADKELRLRYATRFVNSAGQKASFSNFLLIEPTGNVAQPPAMIAPKVTQDSIKISWSAPLKNIDGSQPAAILGFNLYRIADNSSKPLNRKPITETSYDDQFFEFEKTYRYYVRAVSVGLNGEPIESLDSDIIEVTPKDTFSPSAPTGVTVAASTNLISLFFALNPEKDIEGYRIYRSVDPNLPKSDWQLLNDEILKTNTFRDTKVERSTTYYYYVVSIDKFKNTSEPSEVVSENIP